MLSLEDNAVRVSTVALLTLSALAVQNAHQQVNANPVVESSPGQLPPASHTNDVPAIAANYVETSPPEIVSDRQFASTDLPPASPTTNSEATSPSVTVPAIVPASSQSSTPAVETVAKTTSQAPLAEAIELPVVPFQLPSVITGDRPLTPMLTNPEPITPTVQIQTQSQVNQMDDRPEALPSGLSPRSDLPAVTVSQRSRPLPTFYTPGIRQRRVSVSQLRTVRVTNRTPKPILIELVGRTSPLWLNPGQTRSLRADPQDLSLLYWNPDVQSEFDARISQPDRRVLVVDLFPSRFPIGSLGLYLPEPVNRPDIIRIF